MWLVDKLIINKLGDAKSAKFSNLEFLGRIDKKLGVYIIRYLEGGSPKRFTRLNGIDEEGILCIGKSVNLRRRIREFLKDIATKGLAEKYHSEGWNFRKYFRDNPNPKAIKPEIENMEVFWKAMNSEDEADKLETELIQDYVLIFQDKPPLNISIKRKRKR